MIRYSAVVILIAACSTASAQIPVTDAASIGHDLAHFAEIYVKWRDQLAKMREQFEQLKETHEALTGVRNIGDVFDDPELRQYLPDDWRDVYREMKRNGYDGLVRKSLEIYNDNKVHDACAEFTIEQLRKSCEARAIKSAQDQAFASEAYDLAIQRSEQIRALQNEINATEDPKAIAELQARISIEQTNMANEQTKLDLHRMMTESETLLHRQRNREIHARAFASTRSVEVEPLAFD